jgi:predicted RNA binding protein YcfA (HicA-like mRNA interferase family)
MAKKRKILEKILAGSKNIRFDDLITLLEALGFQLNRISGSHHIFEHPSLSQPVSVQPDKNGQAKDYQIKQLLKLIEKYDLKLEEDTEE